METITLNELNTILVNIYNEVDHRSYKNFANTLVLHDCALV